MIAYFGAIFLVIGFIVILKLSRLTEASTRVLKISRQAVADLRDVNLDDDAKERVLQGHAKQLFGLFLIITIGGLSAIAIPVVIIWCLDRIQLLSIDAVFRVALSWPFLIITTALIGSALIFRRVR